MDTNIPRTGSWQGDVRNLPNRLAGVMSAQDAQVLESRLCRWGVGAWHEVRRMRLSDGRTVEQVWQQVAPTRRRVPRPHEAVRQMSRGRPLSMVEESHDHPQTPGDALNFFWDLPRLVRRRSGPTR